MCFFCAFLTAACVTGSALGGWLAAQWGYNAVSCMAVITDALGLMLLYKTRKGIESQAEKGIVSADVGWLTDGVGMRIVQKDETIHYRNIQCEEDELARLWALYPRNE